MVFRSNFAFVISLLMGFVFVIMIDEGQAKPLERLSMRECRRVDDAGWARFSESIKGKELVAFASWCSSCREKLMSTKSAPERFIFISVFEEPEQSMKAMNRLGLTSPCIYGPDLAAKLEITALPWSRQL